MGVHNSTSEKITHTKLKNLFLLEQILFIYRRNNIIIENRVPKVPKHSSEVIRVPKVPNNYNIQQID